MSFEEERLSILARVSNGEISPQEGSLEIAMLKVKYQQGHEEPGLTASPHERDDQGAHQGPFRGPFQAPPFGAAPPRALTWPLMLALAVPFLLIGGLVLGGMVLFLALPTYLFVALWNHWAAAGGAAPELSFWPTLGFAVMLFFLLSLLRWRRRLRVYMNRQL